MLLADGRGNQSCVITMADHAEVERDENIFVYTGGRVPEHLRDLITHARIDESITEVDERAFDQCTNLLEVDFHDRVYTIHKMAFQFCTSLKSASLRGVRTIDSRAFFHCINITNVKFGSKLRTIGARAFQQCNNLQYVKIPSVWTIGFGAFFKCEGLTDVEFGEGLVTLECRAFNSCKSLRRIALPLKDITFIFDDEAWTQFDNCDKLATVELAGGINKKVIPYLSLQSWRDKMNEVINSINQGPTIYVPFSYNCCMTKTGAIRSWHENVIEKMDYFKNEHYRVLREAMTLLELAVWKANLRQKEYEENSLKREKQAKKARVDIESTRHEQRVTCGADIIIKNVLPFLHLPKIDHLGNVTFN